MQDTISIRPGVRMLELFASLPYKEWYAIGELVDNAIQSYVSNRAALQALHGPDFRLRVEVFVENQSPGSIIVRDNAAGIAEHEWVRALQVGSPPPNTRGLSQFGVGMKAAACWFAHEWTVTSSALGEGVERRVSINVDEAVARNDESVALVQGPQDELVHGTTVVMRRLRRKPWGRGVKKVKDYLASIYRDFLRDGDVEISYNGEALGYTEPPLLVAPRWDLPEGDSLEWRKEIGFTLPSGRSVSGWLGLLEKGAQKKAGLALVYRRKVIVGASDDPYKPETLFGQGNSFRAQRLVGEIDVSAFDVSHTKDRLLWADEEDEVVAELLRIARLDEMPLFRQAESYRASRPARDDLPDFDALSRKIEDALSGLQPHKDAEHQRRSPVEREISGYLRESDGVPTEVEYERTFVAELEGGALNVTVVSVIEPQGHDWVRQVPAADGSNDVRVVVNRSHPFMRKYCESPVQDLEAVWLLGVAIVIGVEQARRGGAKQVGLVLAGVNETAARLASISEA